MILELVCLNTVFKSPAIANPTIQFKLDINSLEFTKDEVYYVYYVLCHLGPNKVSVVQLLLIGSAPP